MRAFTKTANTSWRRVGLGILLAAVFGSLPAGAEEQELDALPLPPRQPVPFGETGPWPGFAPLPAERLPRLPLAGFLGFERWEGLRMELAAPDSGRQAAADVPPATVVAADPGNKILDRESDAFRAIWPIVVAEAREGRASSVQRLLEQNAPATLDGQKLSRSLLFAAYVAGNDFSMADSLFFRMSWNDGGRTATRLAAWKQLEAGRGGDAVRELQSLGEPTLGERGALALARWMEAPGNHDTSLEVRAEGSGLAYEALRLAKARDRLLTRDVPAARSAIRALDPASLPLPWDVVRAEMERRLRDLEETGNLDPTTDAGGYEEAARAFRSREDGIADARLNLWLAAWPDSPYRAAAYLLRAHVRLSAGKISEAESDLRVAERLGDDSLRQHTELLRVFVLAGQSRLGEARSRLEKLLGNPGGESREAGLLFHQVRLARLAGDEETAEATQLRLEEGFPDEPWPLRAMADTLRGSWVEPWRTLPSTPRQRIVVDAPREGPWGELLWGETFLQREGARLEEEAQAGSSADTEAVENDPVADEPAPGGVLARDPLVFAHAGLGAPASFLVGGGLAGITGDLHYRAQLGRSFAQQRNELPDFRRTDWEAGLGLFPGRVELGVAAEGIARTDDNAPSLGLSTEKVESSWWGVGGDAAYADSVGNKVGASMAHGRGEVENGADIWKTEQLWFGVEGEIHNRHRGVWESSLTVAGLDARQPGVEPFKFWFRDLRVAFRRQGKWHLGVRGALYDKRALLMPVAGVEQALGSGWWAWAASEPSLKLPSFREVFVNQGDWNVPDFTLPAERRYLDLHGGLRWDDTRRFAGKAGVGIYRTGELRTWRFENGLWVEDRRDDATGIVVETEGRITAGRFAGNFDFEVQSLRADGDQVPYVPTYIGRLEFDYRVKRWKLGLTTLAVSGREDEGHDDFGAFARWDLEVAYRHEAADLPLGFRSMEFTLRVENLTDVEDRRWPGIPSYGMGIYAGVQALYGN